ncbi:malto-oligosyltrehalose synthase [Oryzifoliimicrobium ureilyticus]|uniref:malto-oligosyltrehalose synthase n=1 Tax=Oryzifoliimicrobium ureilyticus TaxID=3113724 RepID=UPI00307667D0
MTIPSSTYRLQFRNGMTFERAAALVPYLKSLGISHFYASPIFTATEGSTHGYDITDANEIDPQIGGRSGFDILAQRLREEGLGLIIDIVPNHMAASLENGWWRDVIEHGRKSRYAHYFDIDWNERLTLPVLGKPFDQAVADGELKIIHGQNGRLDLAYFDNRFPLSEESSIDILAETSDRPEALEALSKDSARMQALHERQHWQLLYWKEASKHLSYRRFFEVTGLVGLRVEDEQVFADSHRLILDLVREGIVQGLRVDHVDGLADPGGYLKQLRAAAGPETFIVVEKILGAGEVLPSDWPISGTTGYEFIAAMPDLFVDADGLDQLDAAYRGLAGETADFQAGLSQAKTSMSSVNFAGEVSRLTRIAQKIDSSHSREDLAKAIRALLVAFPVYRTYGVKDALGGQDRAVLDRVAAHARQSLSSPSTLDFIVGLLSESADSGEKLEFRARFQQLSGPVMAKAMEDTFFYRYNRLIATNEVGGEPQEQPGGISHFHHNMQSRRLNQPHGLSASSTHDTKRGEDARARLYALSEGADIWQAGFERWREMNKPRLINLDDGAAPEQNVEWMLYQALAGIWPEDLQSVDHQALTERFLAYVEKALREAKLRTDWAAENAAYEKAVSDYAEALLSPSNMGFQEDFGTTLRPFIQTGYLNSLAQTLIKLTAPGIPDIYQGAEGLDFSLVDPDNRRDIDFDRLRRALSQPAPLDALPVQDLKQRIIAATLQARQQHASLFAEGSYVPLTVEGERADHVVAYARQDEEIFAITVVPRLMFGKLDASSLVATDAFWGNTKLLLSPDLSRASKDAFTGRVHEKSGELAVADLLGRQPVCLLVSS